MKVAIGSKIIHGSWGGGNLFVKNLKNYLINNGVEVVNDLTDLNIDIILITDPRIDSTTSTISLFEARVYKKLVNKNVKLIHRINECDERKNTNYVNKKMIRVSKYCDLTIFVSSWISNLYKEQGIKVKKSMVILSGSDTRVFNNLNKKLWDKKTKLRIVTHHWGNNWNKGFEIYSLIDNLLEKKEFSDKFEFTYIGNLPLNFSFKNAKFLGPKSGNELAAELKSHNIYITGSINEPSGNHQIEGSLCGLPVLYLNSGGITEYQSEHGIEFKSYNLEEKLNEIYKNYDYYFDKNKSFNFNSEIMSQNYLNAFKSLINHDLRKNNLYLSNFYNLIFNKKIVFLIRYMSSKITYQYRMLKN